MLEPFSSGETVCGPGSRMAYTEGVRAALPDLLQRYGVKILCDAGCGDQNWISSLSLDCEYRGFDLYFGKRLDITTDALPACDLILCRDVLIHMCDLLALRALELFRQSAPLLLATSYDEFDNTAPMGKRGARRMNLEHAPFSMHLIERIEEKDEGKFLGLWKL